MIGLLLAALVVGSVTWLVFNANFHSLAHYPGPWIWRASRMPFVLSLMSGRLPHRVNDLHRQYGPVVRIAPDELSFNEAAAWRDIYFRQALDRPNEAKGKPPGVEADTFITASASVHARLRKPFNPAFSPKAVQAYEPVLTRFVDKFIAKVGDAVALAEQPSIDLDKWLNFLFFDITMDLGWGSSFDCLDHQQYNVWMTFVMALKEAVIAGALNYVPLLRSIMPLLIPPAVKKQVNEVMQVCADKVSTRLNQSGNAGRSDILGFAQEQPSYAQLSREEIDQASFVIITAGSETLTSTLMGTLTYMLTTNEHALDTLVKEIRTSFRQSADIDARSTSALPYLNAVLKEGLRLAAPIPDGMRRVVPPTGLDIAGHWVPGNTVVSTGCLVQAANDKNFSNPSKFIPERWLVDQNSPNSETCDHAAFNPFSLGSRGCLGQPLAWMELRIVLAKLLWSFDVSIAPGQKLTPWHEQDIFWFWDKKPCPLTLRPVKA